MKWTLTGALVFQKEAAFKLELQRAFPKTEIKEGTVVSEETLLKTRRDRTVGWQELCCSLPNVGWDVCTDGSMGPLWTVLWNLGSFSCLTWGH